MDVEYILKVGPVGSGWVRFERELKEGPRVLVPATARKELVIYKKVRTGNNTFGEKLTLLWDRFRLRGSLCAKGV